MAGGEGVITICRSLRVAAPAGAEEDDIMPVDGEASGGQVLDVRRAARHVEDPVALSTEEVVMMAEARSFVAGRLIGDRHGADESRLFEGAQRPIDRRDTQGGHRVLRGVEQFFGTEWPLRLVEGLTNRGPLSGLSLGHEETVAVGLVARSPVGWVAIYLRMRSQYN